MKRLLYVLGIIVVIVIVVLIGYFLRPRDGALPGGQQRIPVSGGISLPPVNTKAAPSLGGLPDPRGTSGQGAPAGSSKAFGVVAANPVLDYMVTGKNEVLIIEPTGRVVRIRDGKEEVLSSSPIEHIARAAISADGNYLFAIFGEANTQVALFDVEAREWEPLEEEVHDPAWSPSGHSIAFLSRAELTGPAVIATFNAQQGPSTARPIVKLHIQDVELSWPKEQTILVQERSSGQIPGSAFLVDTSARIVSLVAHDQHGLLMRWSPTRDEGLLFRTNDNRRGGTLFLLAADGSIKHEFQFATLPNKCVFADIEPLTTSSGPTPAVICGTPTGPTVFQSKFLPDAYLQKGFYMPDALYRVNLESGGVENLFVGAGIEELYLIDITNAKVFNNTLFFVNRFDNRLYGLALTNSDISPSGTDE